MTPEQRSTIDKAATLKGATITQWALDHLMADARKDIEEETTIRLSARAFDEWTGEQFRALYHPDGRDDGRVHIFAGKTRIIDIYNDLAAGYELDARGRRR